jgi:hypothetical protein
LEHGYRHKENRACLGLPDGRGLLSLRLSRDEPELYAEGQCGSDDDMTRIIDITDLVRRRCDFIDSHLDQCGHRLWLRHIDRMTARDFADR